MLPSDILVPLVGAYFHPPAALIIPLLAAGQELILEPEPSNPFDSNAIKVMLEDFDVSLLSGEALMAMGLVYEDIEDKTLMLGYIAREQSAMHPRGPLVGNITALSIISSGPNWSASLAFAPDGKPLVSIQEFENAA